MQAQFTQQDVLQDIQDLYAIRNQLHEALERRALAEKQRQEAENEVMRLASISRDREEYISRLTIEITGSKQDQAKKLEEYEAEIIRLKRVLKERDLSIKGLEFELNASRQREIVTRQKLEHSSALSAHKISIVDRESIGINQGSEHSETAGHEAISSSINENSRTNVKTFRRHSSVVTGRTLVDENPSDAGFTGIFKTMEVSFSSQIQGIQQQFFSSTVKTSSHSAQ